MHVHSNRSSFSWPRPESSALTFSPCDSHDLTYRPSIPTARRRRRKWYTSSSTIDHLKCCIDPCGLSSFVSSIVAATNSETRRLPFPSNPSDRNFDLQHSQVDRYWREVLHSDRLISRFRLCRSFRTCCWCSLIFSLTSLELHPQNNTYNSKACFRFVRSIVCAITIIQTVLK